jgi:hypothetical protein
VRKYSIAFRVKNTNDFKISEKNHQLSLDEAEERIAVYVSNCGYSYEDIKLFVVTQFTTKVQIRCWDRDNDGTGINNQTG